MCHISDVVKKLQMVNFQMEIIVGEFFPIPVTGEYAFLSVYSEDETSGHIELRNWNNDICHVSKFDLVKGGNVIDVPSLTFGQPVCTNSIWSVDFTVTSADKVVPSEGTLIDNGGGSFTIDNITSAAILQITLTNSFTGCSIEETLNGPDCDCIGTVGAPISNGDEAVCFGNPLPALSVTVGTDETANWYDAPTAGLLLAQATTSFTPSGAGTFYVEAENTISGCISDTRTVISLIINDLPTANAGDDDDFCQGTGGITLDASGSSGAVPLNYSWDNAGTLSDPNIENPLSNPNTTTNYTVTITDANGCSATDEVTITVIPLPTVDIVGDNDLCLNETTTLTASGGTLYEWSSGEIVAAITVNPTSNTDYTVTVTENGCIASETITVTVNPLPTADAGMDVFYCEGTLGAPLSGSGGTIFAWTPAIGLSDPSIADPLASPNAAQVYTLTVTDINGCTDTDELMVTPSPMPMIEIASSSPICTNEDLELTETGGNATEWMWTGPDNFTSSDPKPIIAQANVQSGTYTLVITDANECTNTDDLDVTFSAGIDFEAKFLIAPTACVGDTFQLIEISETTELPDAFFWDFGDGTTSTERDPTHIYGAVGTYQVSVTVTEAGCDNFSIVKDVQVNNCRLIGEEGILFYKLYPNVTAGEFRLEVDLLEIGPLWVKVFDLNGKSIDSRNKVDILHFDESFTLNEPGIYFVHIKTIQGQLSSYKVLKVVVVRP